MTTKEAIDELIFNVNYIIEDIEQHEEYEAQEQGEYQIEAYETNKRELEAYCVIFGAIDPSLSTVSGLRERFEKVREERYGSAEMEDGPEPSEEELELYDVLNPWYINGREFDDFTDEEQRELARINMRTEQKRVVLDDDPEDCPEPCEEDAFTFYAYRGRVAVVYNECADCDFYSFSPEFQKKALELIKKHIEEGD